MFNFHNLLNKRSVIRQYSTQTNRNLLTKVALFVIRFNVFFFFAHGTLFRHVEDFLHYVFEFRESLQFNCLRLKFVESSSIIKFVLFNVGLGFIFLCHRECFPKFCTQTENYLFQSEKVEENDL